MRLGGLVQQERRTCVRPSSRWQDSFAVDYLADIVGEAVHQEFEVISELGGVLGAMVPICQRGKIHEESMSYEHKKHEGSVPLVGVNICLPKEGGGEVATEIKLIRSAEEEKGQQIANVQAWQTSRNAVALPLSPQTGEGREGGAYGADSNDVSDTEHLSYLQRAARERK